MLGVQMRQEVCLAFQHFVAETEACIGMVESYTHLEPISSDCLSRSALSRLASEEALIFGLPS